MDFCLRIKDLMPLNSRDEIVVAVPEAQVEHPFWPDVTRQVVGWALGDVLCLNQLPTKFVLFLALVLMSSFLLSFLSPLALFSLVYVCPLSF